jgi:hypothetical protein
MTMPECGFMFALVEQVILMRYHFPHHGG